MNLKEYIEEKVYRLSSSEESNLQELIDNYLEIFSEEKRRTFLKQKTPPEIFYKNNLDKNNMLPLGNIRYSEFNNAEIQTLPVYISFERNSKDRGEVFANTKRDNKNKVIEVIPKKIILYYYKIKFDRKDIKDILQHEIFHLKQMHKIPKAGYGETPEQYWLDPIEVHNYTSNIISSLEDDFKESTTENRKKLLLFLSVFMREGKIPEDVFVPSYFKVKKDFIDTLYNNKDNPKYKKEFQQFIKKIHWIYEQLQNLVANY